MKLELLRTVAMTCLHFSLNILKSHILCKCVHYYILSTNEKNYIRKYLLHKYIILGIDDTNIRV